MLPAIIALVLILGAVVRKFEGPQRAYGTMMAALVVLFVYSLLALS